MDGLPFVAAVSSRALFHMDPENAIFERDGVAAFNTALVRDEEKPLPPGPAFPLIAGLLSLNAATQGKPLVEVVLISGQTPDSGLRVMNSIEHYKLPIEKAAFTDGAPIVPYLRAFGCQMLLSRSASDVQQAHDAGIAAAEMLGAPPMTIGNRLPGVRIAFDGDGVLFSEASELIYQKDGLKVFHEHEREQAKVPMEDGPFAGVLRSLCVLRRHNAGKLIRIALVTTRGAPAHARALTTLRAKGCPVDESFFMGGTDKTGILQAFRPHLFLDDKLCHLTPAMAYCPVGRVPYRTGGAVARFQAEAARDAA